MPGREAALVNRPRSTGEGVLAGSTKKFEIVRRRWHSDNGHDTFITSLGKLLPVDSTVSLERPHNITPSRGFSPSYSLPLIAAQNQLNTPKALLL